VSTAKIFLRHRSCIFVGVVGAAAGGARRLKVLADFERGRIWGMGGDEWGQSLLGGGTKPPRPIALVGS
jgi:hypothetical protein